MPRPTAFHVIGKPAGAVCNLDCRYCFYLEKEALFPSSSSFRMNDSVLETYVRSYIADQDASEVHFTWQGGEPTLLGIEFFRRVLELQERYADGKLVRNALQTNGTLLDDAWGEFLAEHAFLVGVSVDGPRELHDRYRVDRGQNPTCHRAMKGIETLRRHDVEFNTLTVVHDENARYPLEVYRFLKEIGSGFIQFIPLVERVAHSDESPHGLRLAAPPVAGIPAPVSSEAVTPWSVRPEDYGEFLVRIFEEWVRNDVGRVFVQIFDVTLSNWMRMGSSLCVFSETCGRAVALEHNGDVFSCDHYVYPEYRIGNIMNQSLGEMVSSERQSGFGRSKQTSLPHYCRACEVRFACHGECPKHRFMRTPDGEPGLNYLCAAYKRFFGHVDPYMQTMCQLLRQGRAPAEIVDLLA